MIDQQVEISQVMDGSCCGRYVPADEIERILGRLGIERTNQHPEFTPEQEEGFSRGTRLHLPNGTPRHYPPYPGATKHFSERTSEQVRRIRLKAPGIVCATYRNHGRTGQTWGVDIMVAPFNQKANAPQ